MQTDDYLKLCSKGDLDVVKEHFSELTKEQIESLRDEHKAR